MKLIPVEPIGQYTTPAFVDFADGTGDIRDVTRPEYPKSEIGETLRTFRLDREITIREAAARLRIKASELSRLECGSLTLSPEDWGKVFLELSK